MLEESTRMNQDRGMLRRVRGDMGVVKRGMIPSKRTTKL